MSQHDYNLANASGAAFRSDANDVLGAIVTWNSGATAPATTFARMRWADTTAGVIKRRNAANSGWLIESTDDEARGVSRSSNTILDESDIGKTIIATSTFTQTFTAVATLGDGWWISYRNDGVGVITFDPNASETIDGATTLEIYPGESCTIFSNGSAFKTIGRGTPSIKVGSFTRDVSVASGSIVVTGVGFKPRAVFFFAGFGTNNDVASWGFDNGSAKAFIAQRDGVSRSLVSTSFSIFFHTTATGVLFDAVIASMDADGFTLTVTKTGSPSGTATIGYIALR